LVAPHYARITPKVLLNENSQKEKILEGMALKFSKIFEAAIEFESE